jgi:hypothetical protein
MALRSAAYLFHLYVFCCIGFSELYNEGSEMARDGFSAVLVQQGHHTKSTWFFFCSTVSDLHR